MLRSAIVVAVLVRRWRGHTCSAEAAACAAHVALLLQAADEMLFATHVQAELEFGFRFRGRPKDPVLDVPGAVEFFGFSGLEEASPWELSQGGRQRLAL